MGEHIDLSTPDGRIGGWLALPEGAPRGGVVIVQEIFGVNAHIRSVVDLYAASGFAALAPALFDPVEAGVELDYDDAGMARGRELAAALGFDRALAGVAAAADALRASLASAGDAVADRSTPASLLPSGEGGAQRRMRGDTAVGTQPSMPDVSLDSMGTHRTQSGIAVIGFCWGGSVAFLANTRLGLTAVSYYGARSLPFIHEPLRAPMLFHFGERDHWISTADIEATRTAQPTAQVHVWPANHGFNCDARHDYDATCAHDALKVTLAFLDRALMR